VKPEAALSPATAEAFASPAQPETAASAALASASGEPVKRADPAPTA
jgi:hypothetical protein